MAEQKAVCGGFLVGDGLEMNGKVLSATGGGGGIRVVECHSNNDYSDIQCELSAEQVIDLYNSGVFVVLKMVSNSGVPVEALLYPISHIPVVESMIPFDTVSFATTTYDSPSETLSCVMVTFTGNGMITGNVHRKQF